MIKHICQFVAAAGLAAVALTPKPAEARMRNLDGHGCRMIPSGYVTVAECPVPTGSEFNPSTINMVIVDGRTAAGYVMANACRRGYSGTTVTCSNEGYTYYSTAGSYNKQVDATVMKGGMQYDYRWVHLVLPAGEGSDVNGVYVANSDP